MILKSNLFEINNYHFPIIPKQQNDERDRVIQRLAQDAPFCTAWLSNLSMHINWGNSVLLGIWNRGRIAV